MNNIAAPISLAQVTELASGSWVNSPFIAIADHIKTVPKKKGGNFWVIKLLDTTGSAEVEASMFTVPKFMEGDTIEIAGQGIKYEDGQYGKRISWGDKASVTIVTQRPAQAAPATPPSRAPGSSSPNIEYPHGLPMSDRHAKFHKSMKRLSLLRLHCIVYADQIVKKAADAGILNGERMEMVNTIGTGLYIEACRRGMDADVGPIGIPSEEPAPIPASTPAAQPVARAPGSSQPTPSGNPTGQAFPTNGPDEDVPF